MQFDLLVFGMNWLKRDNSIVCLVANNYTPTLYNQLWSLGIHISWNFVNFIIDRFVNFTLAIKQIPREYIFFLRNNT